MGKAKSSPGPHGVENYSQAWSQGSGVRVKGSPVARMMANSFVIAVVIAVGKIAVSLISAYAVVFFAFPLRMFFFWMIFITLMLPVEVRIIPTFKVVSDLHLINTFGGLTLPLIASATATLLFRQFFMTIPDELVEAAKIDGAGPCASSATSCCRCRGPTSRPCSSSSSCTAGTSTCGRF